MKKNLLLATLFLAISFGMYAQDTTSIAPIWDAFTRGWPNNPDKRHTSYADYSAQGAGRTELSMFHSLNDGSTFENRVITMAFLLDDAPDAIQSVILEYYNSANADLGDGANLEIYVKEYTNIDSVPTWGHLGLGEGYGTLVKSFTLATTDSLSWISLTSEQLTTEAAACKTAGKPLCLVLKYNDEVDGSKTLKVHSSMNESGNGPVLKVVEEVVSVEMKNVNTVSVFPNPASDVIYFSEVIMSVQLYSITGALVMESNVASGQINISDVQPGLYIANIKTLDGKSSNNKVYIK